MAHKSLRLFVQIMLLGLLCVRVAGRFLSRRKGARARHQERQDKTEQERPDRKKPGDRDTGKDHCGHPGIFQGIGAPALCNIAIPLQVLKRASGRQAPQDR